MINEFIECDACREKSGSPVLCDGCLKNRSTINCLEMIISSLRSWRKNDRERATAELEELESLIDTDEKDKNFRIERLTSKIFKYVSEVLQRNSEIKTLQRTNDQYAQTLFKAAGHITAVKEPTKHGLFFASQIYKIISEKHFPTREYDAEQARQLRLDEACQGLQETIEARKGR